MRPPLREVESPVRNSASKSACNGSGAQSCLRTSRKSAMSRNFELLQKLGKEQELLGSVPVEPSSAAAAAAAPGFVGPATPPQQGLEEITGIVQQVFLMPAADAPRVVVFAGTEPGTGVTWVTARVAEALASRVAASVCIVDANLRAPGMHHNAAPPIRWDYPTPC